MKLRLVLLQDSRVSYRFDGVCKSKSLTYILSHWYVSTCEYMSVVIVGSCFSRSSSLISKEQIGCNLYITVKNRLSSREMLKPCTSCADSISFVLNKSDTLVKILVLLLGYNSEQRHGLCFK